VEICANILPLKVARPLQVLNLESVKKKKKQDKNGGCWFKTGPFWGPVTKLRIASISFVLSVSPHGTAVLPPDGFPFKLVFEYFFENIQRKFKFH